MKNSIGRRSILGLIASAPVMARAATAKVLGNNAEPGRDVFPGTQLSGPNTLWEGSEELTGLKSHWVHDELRNLTNGKRREALNREFSRVSYLDPDIAAMRSISLSTALRMQRNRNVDRAMNEERQKLTDYAISLFGVSEFAAFWKSVGGE